jgi:hypothetical protein
VLGRLSGGGLVVGRVVGQLVGLWRGPRLFSFSGGRQSGVVSLCE